MTLPAASYFRYFAFGPETRRWGLALTAAGHTRIPAGAPYPLNSHPADHALSWERGRVLEALQIVFISSGRGWFESAGTGVRAVEPGTAFVILPKTWHRYRPDPTSGWTESWIEVQGPIVNNLIRARVFSANLALEIVPPAAGLEEALDSVHQQARTAGPGFSPTLAAAALAVLAAWEKAGRIQPDRSRLSAAILEAERLLADHISEPVNVEAIARRLGIGYSHFRRAFKAHTGFAPWQYVLHLRVSRARRILSSSDATLDAVAHDLGFSSGFHLSSAFKRAYGIAPEHWRKQFARVAPSVSQRSSPFRRRADRSPSPGTPAR
jgi:AraC-like DNA-binding protein